MWTESFQKQIRFQPGDLIAYNNRRVTHGRNAFTFDGTEIRNLQVHKRDPVETNF